MERLVHDDVTANLSTVVFITALWAGCLKVKRGQNRCQITIRKDISKKIDEPTFVYVLYNQRRISSLSMLTILWYVDFISPPTGVGMLGVCSLFVFACLQLNSYTFGNYTFSKMYRSFISEREKIKQIKSNKQYVRNDKLWFYVYVPDTFLGQTQLRQMLLILTSYFTHRHKSAVSLISNICKESRWVPHDFTLQNVPD